MVGRNYDPAYEAYQQAVFRDGRNPSFWNAVGELYYNVNQPRDAYDAYSRGIRLNPYISELWFNLGRLYETPNGVDASEAIVAYSRARELDPSNLVIPQRLKLLTDRLNHRHPDIDHNAANSVSATNVDIREVDNENERSDNGGEVEVVDSREDYNDNIRIMTRTV
jgi:cytochrome c-type biogenesis protein CcmH/NrfG